MRKALVRVEANQESLEFADGLGYVTGHSVAGTVTLEFDYGDGRAALDVLDHLVEDVRRQIMETMPADNSGKVVTC